MTESYFMIFLQPEEQLALKYILKNWVSELVSKPHGPFKSSALLLDTYLDLAKDLDGVEPDSFVIPLQRVAIFRSALESFYNLKPALSQAHMIIAGKHYEMLAKWFFEDKVAMTKDEVLNLGSHYGVI